MSPGDPRETLLADPLPPPPGEMPLAGRYAHHRRKTKPKLRGARGSEKELGLECGGERVQDAESLRHVGRGGLLRHLASSTTL